ncbi:maleylpyruvate isomerase N-terminal domain-containing protein [Luteococcus sp. H138]|uniref:maleylpyruvate isomerase N-terminal domain-containing protein n=1 Tax=unclassified Luteococcus TaxID=2639923 RepID=UPI00313B044D
MSEDRKAVAERHAAVTKNFSRIVEHVSDWGAPTPVPGWTALDVVKHLVEWSRGLFGSVEGVTFGQIGSTIADPVDIWHHHCEQMQMLLSNAKVEELILDDQHFGKMPLVDAIDKYYSSDVFMHSWDLAVATGQQSGLDAATCAAMLEGMEKEEAQLRASGEFGERQPVGDDASSEQKLMAFIGRDPYWTPPAEDA